MVFVFSLKLVVIPDNTKMYNESIVHVLCDNIIISQS